MNEQKVLELEMQVAAADELDWLMSQALDGELDAEGEARLEELLAQEAAGSERWATWQVCDAAFAKVPATLPPVDFAAGVERRIAIYERQRRLRNGVLFGAAAVTLWTGALAAMFLLGAFLWTNQGVFLGGLVHDLAAWWTAVRQVVLAFVQAGESLLATQETQRAIGIYLCTAALILAGWVMVLQRTLQAVPEHDA